MREKIFTVRLTYGEIFNLMLAAYAAALNMDPDQEDREQGDCKEKVKPVLKDTYSVGELVEMFYISRPCPSSFGKEDYNKQKTLHLSMVACMEKLDEIIQKERAG